MMRRMMVNQAPGKKTVGRNLMKKSWRGNGF